MTKVTDLTGEEEQVLKLEYDRDKNIVKSKAAYWGIYLFWTIIFLIGCLMMA